MALVSQVYFSSANTQVIRIQPQESIYLKINNKVPGLGLRLDNTRLDLPFHAMYDTELPDAYERLLLDVINGKKDSIPVGNHKACYLWQFGHQLSCYSSIYVPSSVRFVTYTHCSMEQALTVYDVLRAI